MGKRKERSREVEQRDGKLKHGKKLATTSLVVSVLIFLAHLIAALIIFSDKPAEEGGDMAAWALVFVLVFIVGTLIVCGILFGIALSLAISAAGLIKKSEAEEKKKEKRLATVAVIMAPVLYVVSIGIMAILLTMMS